MRREVVGRQVVEAGVVDVVARCSCERSVVCRVVSTVLVATDADWVDRAVRSALSVRGHEVARVSEGVDVAPGVAELAPDLVIVDFQIGAMGGPAVTWDLRLESEMGRLPHTPVLLLLDRQADVFLARECGADDWVTKPLDALTIGRAVDRLLDDAQRAEQPVGSDTSTGSGAAW